MKRSVTFCNYCGKEVHGVHGIYFEYMNEDSHILQGENTYYLHDVEFCDVTCFIKSFQEFFI